MSEPHAHSHTLAQAHHHHHHHDHDHDHAHAQQPVAASSASASSSSSSSSPSPEPHHSPPESTPLLQPQPPSHLHSHVAPPPFAAPPAAFHTRTSSSSSSSPSSSSFASSSSSSSFSSNSSDHHGHSHASHDHSHSHSHSHGGNGHTDSLQQHKGSANPLLSSSSFDRSSGPSLRLQLSLPLLVSIFTSPDAQPLSAYLLCKFCFTVTLFLTGIFAASTTLISHSFHVLFDCAAMACSLYAVLAARQRPRFVYGYGFSRFEVVAAFTNAIFLYFVATFLAIELFHVLSTGESEVDSAPKHEIEHQIVWLGLLVDAIGVTLFWRWARLSSLVVLSSSHFSPSSSSSTSSSSSVTLASLTQGAFASHSSSTPSAAAVAAHDVNMHSIWLFTMSDLVQHLLFVVSTYLPYLLRASWLPHLIHISISSTHLHSISYALTALILIRVTTPLFSVTARVLLASAEAGARLALERAIREISFGEGVLEVRQAHFWSQAPMSARPFAAASLSSSASSSSSSSAPVAAASSIVGSIIVRCRADCDSQLVLHDVHACLGKICTQLTVAIEKDQPLWMTASL